MRYTDRSIRALPAVERETFDWIPGTPGLGVRRQRNGAASYIVKFYEHGRARRMTLGRVTEMDLADARTEAARVRLAVRDGHDPAAERRARREAATVSGLLPDFIADITARRKPATARRYASEF